MNCAAGPLRLAELGVPGYLCLGSLDDQLGAVRWVVSNLLLPLRDLLDQRGDEALLLEPGGDPVGDAGDRLGLPLVRLLEPRGLLVAQLGEVTCPLAIILRVRLEDNAFDLVYLTIGNAFRGGELFDKLLGNIPGPRKRYVAVGVATIEGARGRLATAPGNRRRCVADQPARSFQKRRADVLVASHPAGEIASQPTATTSTKAVIPDPERP